MHQLLTELELATDGRNLYVLRPSQPVAALLMKHLMNGDPLAISFEGHTGTFLVAGFDRRPSAPEVWALKVRS